MIVVSLTSWTRRIDNVKKVVESIMSNTIQPDRVYLNLSSTEFDGIDLPIDLVEYFESDERLIINWIPGENTKSMKKIFPILKYLNNDDFILDADDDKLYPKDLIESRLADFEKYGRKYPVTSNHSRCGIGDALVISPMTLFQKKMLNNWDRYVNDKIVRTYNDDRTYMYVLFLNGYVAKPCSKYTEKELNANYDLHLDDSSMRSARMYPIGRKYDEIAAPVIHRLTNKTISQSFGFFKKKLYDCVMVYGKSGIDSKEMTCGKHLELEYVVASLRKYCSSWCGRIFIVGSEPPKQIKNFVIHIPCNNPYTHCKDANIIHKLRYACENIKDLSNDFLMISDDQIVTKESKWEDMTPRYVRKYSDWDESKWLRNKEIDFWHKCLYKTLKKFHKDKAVFWEPHIWSPINKSKFIEMCNKYDYKNDIGCISQSLYYNFINQKPVKGFDHTHISNSNTNLKISKLNNDKLDRHLSWSDSAFSMSSFRDLLDRIVGFSNDNKEVKAKINRKTEDKIRQFRNDIISGKVIKVPNGTGGFIWKRVK